MRIAKLLALLSVLMMLCRVAPALAQETVLLRAGNHQTHVRLVFEWPEKVAYQAAIQGDALHINFSKPFTADYSAAMRKLAEFIETPVASSDKKQVRIPLRRAFVLQSRQFGGRVVFDLLKDKKTKTSSPPQRKAIASAAATKSAHPVRLFKKPLSLAAPAPAPKVKPKTAAIVSERSATEIEADRQRAQEQVKTEEKAKQDAAVAAGLAQAASEAQETPAEIGKDGVTSFDLRVKQLPNGLRLRFPFSIDVAAAVFYRGPVLWVVFDKPARIAMPLVALTSNAVISAADQIEDEDFTAVAFRVAPGYFAKLERRRSIWQIDLIREAVTPSAVLPVIREPEADAGGMVHVRSAHPSGPFTVLDPYVGDSMLVMPVLEVSQAVMEPRRYIEFELMQTLQGAAIIPFSSRVQVKAVPGLISISEPSGLLMSDELARLLGKKTVQDEIPEPPLFMDFDRWRRGNDSTFLQNERQLRADIASSVLKKRAANQKNLARLYLAYGLDVESLAVLKIMANENADIDKDLQYRGLLAISNYQLGRYAEADKALSVLQFQNDPHALLWRGAIRARQSHWESALADFDTGFTVIGDYPAAVRVEMQLLAATAALAKGEYNRVERELAAARTSSLSVADGSRWLLLRGRLSEARGKDDAALKSYDGVIKRNYRPTEIQARLAKILLLNRLGTIDNAKAIQQLETARYAWRNDEVELTILEALGERYFANNDFRDGLTVMRDAATHFSGSDQSRQITDRMSEVFADLFLHGGSDEMPPVKTLALYYDFRELTPLGAEGDEMIRRLGERLVTVDLLDEAIELFEHQVTNRLEGTAKAVVATRLAVIELLDKKPTKALETIRRTRQTRLPEDLTLRRLMLEARALTELSEFDQALELIVDEQTKEADLLRADIYWAAQNWALAADSLQKVLGNRSQDPAPLTPATQAQVMRAAIAYALAGKQAELDVLRTQYLTNMAKGPYSDGFAVITQSNDGRGIAFRQLAGTIAGIDTLKDFMASYRRDL